MSTNAQRAEQLFRAAVAHHQAGQLAEAEQLYQTILAAYPAHAASWNLLGVARSQGGQHALAAEAIERAIALDRNLVPAYNNLGNVMRALGRHDRARECYDRALAIAPSFVEALNNLAALLQEQGRRDEAVQCYRRSLAVLPDDAKLHNNLGVLLHELGRWSEAGQSYRRALEIQPDYATAHNNLATLLLAEKKLDDARHHLDRAIELVPSYAQAHANLGLVLKAQGDTSAALESYRRALAIRPGESGWHNDFGNLLRALGQPTTAVAHYREAIRLNGENAEALNNLGLALGELGQNSEAIQSLRRAIEVKPRLADAHSNLGNVLSEQGLLDEAVACFQRALEISPDYALAHNNLGSVWRKLNEHALSEQCFRRAIELTPEFAEAHSNLGAVLQDLGRYDEALAHMRRAAELGPRMASVHSNLGTLLHELGRGEESIACFQRAIELQPDFVMAYQNLGTSLADLGRVDEAIASYRRAVELKPDNLVALGDLVHQMQQACQWTDLERLSRHVVELEDSLASDARGTPLSPFTFLALPTVTTADQQRRCAERLARKQTATLRRDPLLTAARTSVKRDSRLTIGYLSADLHTHATALLMAELFEAHDRTRFRVHAYSYGPDDASPMRSRLVRSFDRFVELRMRSYLEMAQEIRNDEVDILVDLKGYTQRARPQVMLLRPAPIQVNYLGYPGTMGTAAIDYILVDQFVVPVGQQPHYTEHLVHLPGCYQVNDSRREVSAVTPTKAECGLCESSFVFCSFNNNYKITPAVFDVWMRLLATVPDSQLWLFAGNRFAPANLRREAAARGVLPDRLVFAEQRPPAVHLARHRLADLFLDTFPYNAHTTASDALFLGVPLVTMAGETFPARVAGSLLRALGLHDLVTTNIAEYERLALRLATNPVELATVRARLKAARTTSGVFDGAKFARSLERAYQTMHERHAAGLPPQGFRVD